MLQLLRRGVVLSSCLLLLSSCAIAPLSQGDSARPAGAGRLEAGFQWTGYTRAGGTYVLVPMGRARYGLTDRLSLVAQSEFRALLSGLDYGYWSDPDSGLYASVSVQLVFGYGNVSYGAGHIVSLLAGDWEPFFGITAFVANLEPGSFDGRFFSTPPSTSATLFVFSLGTKYWVSERLALGFHVNGLLSSAGFQIHNPFLHSLSAVFKW